MPPNSHRSVEVSVVKQTRSRLGAVALALVMVIAAFAISLPAAAQSSDATEIDSCTVIDEPGTYVLTENIEDSDEDVCIRVVGDIDGVVIDGNGHTIDGTDAENSVGVFVDGEDDNQEGSANPTDVTIRDLTLTDWDTGISFGHAGGDVTDVTATSNDAGLSLFNSGADVTDSDFSNNEGDGISVDFSRATVSDVTANDNGNAGIWIFESGLDLRDLTLTGNRVGIEEVESSSITITDSIIADNEVPNEYSTDGDSDGAGDDAEDGDDADDGDADAGDSDDGNSDAGDDKNGDDADDGSSDDSDNGDGAVTDVGAQDVAIDLGDVTISDFALDGPGLPDEHVDGRTYSVGDFDSEIDGAEFTIGETDYRVGHVTIDVEPFDVTFENVTLGNGE